SWGGAFGSPPRRTLCAPGAGASGQTVSTTLTTLRSRLRPNSTVPAVSANRVSSLPRPTPSPGWILVRRWRTRISPAPTTWPPKRFTPRRWALESRPFLEELTPFLDAIWDQSFVWSRDRSGDARDLQPGELLAVALALLVTGLVLVAEDADLLAAEVLDLLGGDLDLRELGLGGGDLVTVD